MRRTTRLLPVTLVEALLLAACTTPAPMPPAPPTPDATPVFASDEEALAAAEEAYGAFLLTLDAILADGGQKPERLLEVASESVLDQESPGFAQMRADGLRGVGSAKSSLVLQSANWDTGEVTAYACDDLSGTAILDSNGQPYGNTESSVSVFEYEVEFLGQPLKVAARSPWNGSSTCG